MFKIVFCKLQIKFVFTMSAYRFVMRPSSLGGGRIMRRTLSVRLSVRLSRYRYRASRRAT